MNIKELVSVPVAVIGFSDKSSPLEPLWPSTHRALLPIAGKALIVHIIEQLVEAGVRHIRIAGSIQQYAVRKRLGDGSEWGVTVRYSDLHGDDLRMECLLASGTCLYLLGDVLNHGNLKTLVRRSDYATLEPDLYYDAAGMWQLCDGNAFGYSLGLAGGELPYENALVSVSDYHDANLRAAQGLLPRLNLPGARIHSAAIADWKTHIANDAFVGTDIFVGKHSKIGSLARLERNCILSNGVIVDNGVRIENVSVLPNCYVGRSMSLRDAVLGPGGVLGLDGTFWPTDDRRLLASTRDNREALTGIPSRRIA
jgi:NDP-sugar pyrophosphorylase family protein